MKPMIFKVLKGVVGVASLALPFVTGYFENRTLDDKIAKEVAKALAQSTKK